MVWPRVKASWQARARLGTGVPTLAPILKAGLSEEFRMLNIKSNRFCVILIAMLITMLSVSQDEPLCSHRRDSLT